MEVQHSDPIETLRFSLCGNGGSTEAKPHSLYLGIFHSDTLNTRGFEDSVLGRALRDLLGESGCGIGWDEGVSGISALLVLMARVPTSKAVACAFLSERDLAFVVGKTPVPRYTHIAYTAKEDPMGKPFKTFAGEKKKTSVLKAVEISTICVSRSLAKQTKAFGGRSLNETRRGEGLRGVFGTLCEAIKAYNRDIYPSRLPYLTVNHQDVDGCPDETGGKTAKASLLKTLYGSKMNFGFEVIFARAALTKVGPGRIHEDPFICLSTGKTLPYFPHVVMGPRAMAEEAGVEPPFPDLSYRKMRRRPVWREEGAYAEDVSDTADAREPSHTRRFTLAFGGAGEAECLAHKTIIDNAVRGAAAEAGGHGPCSRRT